MSNQVLQELNVTGLKAKDSLGNRKLTKKNKEEKTEQRKIEN